MAKARRPAARGRSAPAGRGRKPARRPAPAPAPAARPGPGQRLWVLDVPYGTAAPGTSWDPAIKARIYIGAHLPADLAPYRSRAHTYERFLEDELNGAPLAPDPPAARKSPRPEQVEGARAVARRAAQGGRWFLLADDTGTGKTGTAILAARAVASLRKATRVLVIADRPAAITIAHWCQSIDAFGDGGLRWCVTTWDRIGKLAGPGAPGFDVVIADEVHLARHQDTKRVRYYWKVARYTAAHRGAPFVIAASATPAHHPAECSYMVPAFAQERGEPVSAWREFGERLAKEGFALASGRGGRWGWDERAAADPVLQARDLRRLRGWLEDTDPPAMIHRAAPWGDAPLEPLPVALTPAQRRLYEQEWAEFAAEMRLARRGRDVARGRAALLRFRMKAGLVRVSETVEWIAARVEAGCQVVASVEFVETAAEPIRQGLEAAGIEVARIYGGGRGAAESERLRFQRGEAKAAVMTVTSSISLHAKEMLADGSRASAAPRVGIIHQARYSGIASRQILGRIHRDYQVGPWWVAYALETVEERITRIMVDRLLATGESVGADHAALTSIAEVLGIDWLPEAAILGEP